MSTLKRGVVIDVPAWKVPVIARKKYLKQPEIAVNVKFPLDDVTQMPEKQFKAFEASFEKRFTPDFQKMSNGWFGDMQKTIDTTEAAIDKVRADALRKPGNASEQAIEKAAQSIVDGVNARLAAKCKTWTEIVQRLAQSAYEAAYQASLEAMKLKVTKAKAKMVAKVVLFVALTLTAAAVTIAVAVVTMGAGAALAPVVIAGIVTAGKALFGSLGEVVKSYDVLGSTIASVESSAKKLSASAAASIKAMQKTAGKLDTASAFYKALSADVGALDKHVGQLDKFVVTAREKTKSRLKEIQALADSLAKAKTGSPDAARLEKDVLVAQKSFDNAMERLRAIDDVKKVAQESREAFTKLQPDDIAKALGRLAPAFTKLKGAASEISKNAPLIKGIADASMKLAAAR